MQTEELLSLHKTIISLEVVLKTNQMVFWRDNFNKITVLLLFFMKNLVKLLSFGKIHLESA